MNKMKQYKIGDVEFRYLNNAIVTKLYLWSGIKESNLDNQYRFSIRFRGVKNNIYLIKQTFRELKSTFESEKWLTILSFDNYSFYIWKFFYYLSCLQF